MMGGWLARLKNQKAPTTPASKPRLPPEGEGVAGFLGLLAQPPAPFQKIEGGKASNGPASNETHGVDLDTLATIDGTDLHTWPHSQAMNPGEVETFTARLARFTDKGVAYAEAERLADVLVMRDREGDDRALCLECLHLQGYGRWRCGNWRAADVARLGLARDLVLMLQRCPGFKNDRA